MKSPEQLFPRDRSSVDRSGLFLLIIKEIFNKDETYLKELLDKLGDKREKLEKSAHFYYFICQPYVSYDDVREELRLVGITSLIEAMMQEVEYKNFFQWFESNYTVNKINDYLKIKEEYLDQFGATRKIKEYFEKYILEDDKEDLIQYIEPYQKQKGFYKFDSITKIAEFLYQMRSDFVHGAKMRSLCPKGCYSALIHVGKIPYKVNIDIEQFMKMFERSFINFWERKAGIIN